MPRSLSYLVIHVIFSTKDRAPLIVEAVRLRLHAYLATVARNSDCECFCVGGIDYTYPTRTVLGVTFGTIGIDASGNSLQTNHFVLSSDRCSVILSYPIAP